MHEIVPQLHVWPAFAKATVGNLRVSYERRLEAPPGFEPGMEVLQTSALPLGDGAPLTGSRARLTTSAKATAVKKPSTTYFDCTCGNESAGLKDQTTAFDEACVVDHRK